MAEILEKGNLPKLKEEVRACTEGHVYSGGKARDPQVPDVIVLLVHTLLLSVTISGTHGCTRAI